MEYAIAGGVAVLFVVLYLLVKPVCREPFCEVLDEAEFETRAKLFARDLPLPERGGKEVNAKKYLKKVRKAAEYKPSEEDKDVFGRLYALFREHAEAIKILSERDFSLLDDLPVIGGVPRTVLIADFLLLHSRYILTEERLDVLLGAVTEKVTPTFEEIRTFPLAFEFCLLKKLAATADGVTTMTDIAGRARRVAAHPGRAAKSSDFRMLKKNAVFNTVCAAAMGYEGKKFAATFGDLADETVFYTENVFLSLRILPLFDFLRYYKPLEITAKYEVLKSCDERTITNYFDTLSSLSEKENLDETAYALRLENYLETGLIPPLKVSCVRKFGKRVAVTRDVDSAVTLARALTSDVAMQLYFGGGKKRGEGTLKMPIKSSKPPKTNDFCVSFGISAKDDTLTVNPAFPPCVKTAEIVFEHGGVEHKVKVERGLSRALTVNGTAMFGVPSVKLGSIPLEIRVGLPENGNKSEN